MNAYTPQLFSINEQEKWLNFLNKEGYVVIKDILTKDEKNHSYELFKKDWCQVSPHFSFNDSKTWTIDNTPMIYGKGMAVFNGFGQSDFMWNLRLNSNIQSLYKTIHQTQELVVSFDGFSVFLSDKQKSKPWLHIDQNPGDNIYSIQGSYNHFPVGTNNSGFVLVPKSHNEYIPKVKHHRNWIPCPEEELNAKSVKLLIPDNCFTLWNSRLIHANTGISKKQNIEIDRLTAYITYLPKSIRSSSVYTNRVQIYKESKTTSHWANKCEPKQYPWGFKKRYESRGYNNILARLDNDDIPKDRLSLI